VNAGAPPSPLIPFCGPLAAHGAVELSLLGEPQHWEAVVQLLTVLAIADAACAELLLTKGPGGPQWKYSVLANRALAKRNTLSTYPIDRVRVLPKTRTSQVGITIRSLSRHLALCRSEVSVDWFRNEYPAAIDTWMRLRLFLFPWPFQVASDAFSPTPSPPIAVHPEKFGFFNFEPKYESDELLLRFDNALARAAKDLDAIDCAVLPESAVTEAEFGLLWEVCVKRQVPVLLAGVRVPGKNQAWLRVGIKEPQTFKQDKHHRWCLDDTQIGDYALGERLHPSRRWWESMTVEPRSLTFLAFNEWLTFCHLVCEDLARIDPVSQIVRAVGPTLVVALLLDGPQITKRWPARYATVLADDPGSSVLTFTAIGMALRSRTTEHPEPNPTIALWKDSKQGSVPIEMAPTSDAVVLTLWADRREEFTADGRSDGGTAGRLILGGTTQIQGRGWLPGRGGMPS